MTATHATMEVADIETFTVMIPLKEPVAFATRVVE